MSKLTQSRLRQIIKEEISIFIRKNDSINEMHGMGGGHVRSGASDEEIDDKIDFFSSRPGKRMWMTGAFSEYEDMAAGGDAGGIRKEYYSNWNDGDFQKVIDVIESDFNS